MSDNQPLIARIQAQLSASARQNFKPIATPPFTIYINDDSDALWSNYAIPDEAVADAADDDGHGTIAAALDALCAVFRAHERQPRFEFVDEFTPMLAPALAAYGFVEELRTQLMICTPATYCPVEAYSNRLAEHLLLNLVAHDGPLAQFQVFMTVQKRAFGEKIGEPVDEVTAEQFRRRFATTQFFAAWLTETGDVTDPMISVASLMPAMVSVASLMPAYDGITEIAGIATDQAYRRQGIAAALTAHAVAEAFSQGLTGVFLTAANAAAGRVYERVGFRTIGTGLAYHLPAAQASLTP